MKDPIETTVRRELRKLPSVDHMLTRERIEDLVSQNGHELTVLAIQETLQAARQEVLGGSPCPPAGDLEQRTVERLAAILSPSLLPVINATGVVVHTNLGRAPLSLAAQEAMAETHAYCNLEYDLKAGQRGSRYVHAEELLCRLTGAEASLVVNNDSGAVLLILSALAKGREVVISRGQLVEIGGGFRIPDVMVQSGASLQEVGTTNRTYVQDYERAIGADTAMLLHVHTSNFRLVGFCHQPPLEELAELAHKHGLIVVDDLGSGALIDTAQFGLNHETTVQESLAAGADLVCFSGDKLLGGPQAGLVIGRAPLLETLRHHPLTRALRVSKTILSGLQATLLHYLRNEAVEHVPVWAMVAASIDTLDKRAQRLSAWLQELGAPAKTVEGFSTVGGGSLPGQTLPTRLVTVGIPDPDAFAQRLRLGSPPVVGRIERDEFVLDLRTVLPAEEQELQRALKAAL
jgi:L-seryl-tRNA(Ser) seleniumtransferase